MAFVEAKTSKVAEEIAQAVNLRDKINNLRYVKMPSTRVVINKGDKKVTEYVPGFDRIIATDFDGMRATDIRLLDRVEVITDGERVYISEVRGDSQTRHETSMTAIKAFY